MRTANANLVQAEFFHIRTKGSLEDLRRECFERLEQGSPIKTAVRFYDRDGRITACVVKLRHLERNCDRIVSRFMHSKRKANTFQAIRFYLLMRRIQKLRAQAGALATLQLEASARMRSEVAVELLDRRFRPACKDELHELSEAARKSTGVWLFVFEHNELIAETNKSIASMM